MDGRNEKNSGNRIRNCDLKFTDWILPSSRRLLDFLDIPHLNKLLDNLDIQNMPELSECLMSWTSGPSETLEPSSGSKGNLHLPKRINF